MKHVISAVTVLVWAVLCGAAWGQESDGGRAADRVVFNRLVREVNEAEAALARGMEQAMKEARANKGQASLETTGKLVDLQQKLDRLNNRLILISLRHGWDIPKVQKPAGRAGSVQGSQPADRIEFSSGTRMIRNRFAEEAKAIGAAVRCPVFVWPGTQLAR